MASPRRSGRSRFPIFVLLLLSATLLTLDARNFGPVESFKDGITAVVSPFRSAGDWAFSPVGNAWENFSNSDDLEAENRELRTRIEELVGERIDNDSAAEELRQLREQLGLRDTVQYGTVVAEVTARSISNFDELVFEINVGSVDGLANGMPVISAGGLIGRVEDTRARSARVRLIADSSVSVGVIDVRSEVAGIMSGQGEGELLRVGNGTIRVDDDVQVGDALVTSGGERSPYPPGLPVGTVADIAVDEASLEKVLIVEPSASLERFEFVTVVLYDPTAEADSGEGS